MQNAVKLENRAKMQEVKAKALQDQNAAEEVNELYIDSIKAKLALLDNLK